MPLSPVTGNYLCVWGAIRSLQLAVWHLHSEVGAVVSILGGYSESAERGSEGLG
jgi:hypothetical protein